MKGNTERNERLAALDVPLTPVLESRSPTDFRFDKVRAQAGKDGGKTINRWVACGRSRCDVRGKPFLEKPVVGCCAPCCGDVSAGWARGLLRGEDAGMYCWLRHTLRK